MDVTCERCGTEYDFDDALVSERGTTVKCTNCGAQFRVYRPVPANGPERWVVRTVDGRELVFSALRELQAAISTGVVGRDDVLSRGGGRPRRLGSIAELEPFFKQAVVVSATSTAPGLGLPSARAHGRQDQSQAFALPRDAATSSGEHGRPAWSATVPGTGMGEPPPKRSGTLPPPPPVLHQSDRSELRMRGGASDPIHTSVTGSMQPTSVSAAPAARLQNLVAADLAEPVTIPRTDPRQTGDRTPAVPIGPPPMAPPMVTARAPIGDATVADDGPPAFADTIAAIGETVTEIDGSAAREQIERAVVPPPARKPEESGVVERRVQPFQLPPPGAPPERAPRSKPPMEGRVRTASIPPITPTPGEMRGSYVPEPEPSVSPRFSMIQSQKRNSSVRWIVGVVLVGATALVAATVGRKYFVAPQPAQTSAPAVDDNVTKLVDAGDKLLREGDLDAAKEKYDKASAFAESDPTVVARLAHLAVVRADQPWLKVRLLPSGAEQSVALAELASATEKMKRAVDAAQRLSPNDAAVRRYRVDALRIAGDRAGARALVAEMNAAGKTTEDDLSLAALDLAEEKPAWPTVIERLRSAVAVDGNLGRARAMLVYALASSGDLVGAKAEHERLKGQSPPHPLTLPLLDFIKSVESARGATSGSPAVSSAPKSAGNAPPASAGSGGGSSPATTGGSQGSTGPKASGGRVSDDYVAPNAGTVDVSDMGAGHAPPPPAPTPQSPPTSDLPAPAPKPPPGVDTSDLPGGK